MGTERRLLMISLDAVSSDDLEILQELPNFSKLRKKGTLVRDVKSVLISNTYPAHTSIITGTHPNKHGVIDNTLLLPERKSAKWRYHTGDIKVPTLFHKAKEQGLTTCSILYPVTGSAKIDYNILEIAGEMNPLKRAYIMLRHGSARYLISNLLRFRKYIKGIGQPALDDLTTAVAADGLVRYKPNLLALHLIDTDMQKHRYGINSEQTLESLHRQDERLGILMDALEKSGTSDKTSIIIFSDHDSLPVHTGINPNNFLIEQGIIQQTKDKLNRYDAYFHNAGGTTFLKLYNPKAEHGVRQAIDLFLKEPYVARKLTNEEMQVSGMDKEYMVGIEATDGYYFGKPGYKAQHGYALERAGYTPFYLAVGKGIQQGEALSGGCITDICPLAANMLGIPLWDMDGINRLN
ncbi:alkaline phosphatase family protein [Desulfuribacillus alkaliarsenatis]|uniref:Phosphodiesterase n=1 Tax=Desulfuribacillus alkaliarsenatis TaxID=766136 RepID=A0A1E5G4R7_9FIRM|nr:ectonucleotide pyrophosphatase/phosphodiesterase [Desulfuribacillus alkaliarsenatis]OEF98171.1 hypothetical protein BHF68_00325 [Desulfuribacillus alkaliarsenatis]